MKAKKSSGKPTKSTNQPKTATKVKSGVKSGKLSWGGGVGGSL
jgi:hypothetical protein